MVGPLPLSESSGNVALGRIISGPDHKGQDEPHTGRPCKPHFLLILCPYGFLKHAIRVPGCRQRGPGFDSRRYQIFCLAVSLERGPLSPCEDK
jgi:hypothetical protein